MMAQTVLLAALVALAAAPTEYRIAIEHSPRRITVTSGDRVVKETPCAEESLFQALHTGMNAIHAESRVGGALLQYEYLLHSTSLWIGKVTGQEKCLAA